MYYNFNATGRRDRLHLTITQYYITQLLISFRYNILSMTGANVTKVGDKWTMLT
jgi:hypothetical protein